MHRLMHDSAFRSTYSVEGFGSDALSASSWSHRASDERNESLMNPHVPPIEAHALRLNVARPLTFHSALEIARREIERLGLNDLYRVKAIYAGGDRHAAGATFAVILNLICLLYTSPSPRDRQKSRMPSSA